MQIADPPARSLSGRKVPNKRNCGQHLNSLKKLVFAINDVVMVQEFFEVVELGFPVPFSGENRFKKPPGVPSNTTQAFGKKGTARIPSCRTLEYLRLCRRTSCLQRERSETGRATRRSQSQGASGGSEGLEDSDLPKRIYRPIQGHRSYWEACGISEQECSRICEINILNRRSFLHHYSLTATKPQSSEKKAR